MRADTKQRAFHRVKIIKGQVEGLTKMIEQEAYCTDILTQSLAIQRALRSLNKLIAEHHIETHVTADLQSGNLARQQKARAELLAIYELTNVRGK